MTLTTYCDPCGRLVSWCPDCARPSSAVVEPPGVALRVYLPCSHDKTVVTTQRQIEDQIRRISCQELEAN